jgi:hypothetical protein
MVYRLARLPLDPKFAGSNPAEDNGLLRAIKSLAQLPSDGKQSRRPHVVTFHGMLKISTEYDRDTAPAKLTDISLQVSSASLPYVCAGELCYMNQE